MARVKPKVQVLLEAENGAWIHVPLALCHKAPWNYKVDDEAQAANLLANIQRNRQVENIILRETGRTPLSKFEVANGNHRLDAFTGAGLTHAVAFNLGKVSVQEAQRLAVETNETRFDTDRMRLAKLISEMDFDLGDLAATMPFTEQQLEDMSKLAVFDMSSFEGRGDTKSFQDILDASRQVNTITFRLPQAPYVQWTRWMGHCAAQWDLRTAEDCLDKALSLVGLPDPEDAEEKPGS